MTSTPNLDLPYLMAAQAQKHVSHNEALRALDVLTQLTIADRTLTAPPSSPANGACYLVAAASTGAWSGRAGQIAAWQDGAWAYHMPREGWTAWIASEDVLLAYDGAAWRSISGTASVNPVALVGVNATADTTNRLAVKSPASLFDSEGQDHRVKINKASAAGTASLLYQTAYSGRAEVGLTGDDKLHVKVSADGTSWKEAIVVDGATGDVRLPLTRTIDGSVFNVRAYGAAGNGVANDRPAIQAALDAAGAAGGGGVFVPPGIYYCTQGLSVPSNVHLYGAGNSTVLRYPPGSLPSVVLSGVNVNAAVAMVGVERAKISNIQIDLRTNPTLGNGIQIGEHGALVRSADCVVERCYVAGHDDHVYLIYVKTADRCKIKDNVVSGITSGVPLSDVTGIEIFGSEGTEICGNRISNCQDGIPIKSENKTGSVVPNSYVRNIDVHDNVVESCRNGISVGVAKNTDAGGATINCDGFNIAIHDNVCANMANRGLILGIDAGGVANNLSILQNTLKECANGCLVIDSDPAAITSALLIQGNIVIQTGGGSAGVVITDISAADIIGNSVSGSPFYAVSISNAANINFIGNVFSGSQRDGIYIAGTSSDLLFLANSFTGYGASAASNGVKAGNNTVTRVSIIDNFFRYGAASSGAYAIDMQIATDCQIADNKIAWTTQSAVFVNGTGGRNNYGSAVWDRNVNRVSAIFPREVGIGLSNTDILTDYLDCGGNSLRLRSSKTPASASDTGAAGRICWDANYVYVCVGTNAWKRAALASW